MKDGLLLSLQGIYKSFDKVHALNDISLTLVSGEMLALLGHNGAGKTTLMKIILGLIKQDSGTANILGKSPGQANQEIGFIPENVSFYPALSGQETLMYFAQLNGLSKKSAKNQVQTLLETVHLIEHKDRPVKQYSKGMKQRLGLAQALLPSSGNGQNSLNPKLLILDEPTVGLDPIATAELFQLLGELQAQGCGIIICTHVLPGLEQFITKALILNRGKVIASGSIDQLLQQANLPSTITPTGLNGALANDATLTPYLQSNGQLKVPSDYIVSVVQHLVSQSGLTNIQVSNPSLPELYQYLVNQTSEASIHEH